MSELFDPQTDEDVAALQRVAKIRVKRMELGKWTYAPMGFAPDTLETQSQVYALFGGGDYTIEFRDVENKWIKAVRFALPGKPLPLVPDYEAEAKPAPAPTVTQPAPGMSEGGLLMQFMMAQMQQTTQILVAVLSKGDAGSDKLLARSQQLEDRARSEHTEFLKTILERANTAAAAAPAGGHEAFMAGIEWAQGMFSDMMAKNGASAEQRPEDFMSSMTQFVQGLAAVGREMSSNGNAGAGVPPANGAAH